MNYVASHHIVQFTHQLYISLSVSLLPSSPSPGPPPTATQPPSASSAPQTSSSDNLAPIAGTVPPTATAPATPAAPTDFTLVYSDSTLSMVSLCS